MCSSVLFLKVLSYTPSKHSTYSGHIDQTTRRVIACKSLKTKRKLLNRLAREVIVVASRKKWSPTRGGRTWRFGSNCKEKQSNSHFVCLPVDTKAVFNFKVTSSGSRFFWFGRPSCFHILYPPSMRCPPVTQSALFRTCKEKNRVLWTVYNKSYLMFVFFIIIFFLNCTVLRTV